MLPGCKYATKEVARKHGKIASFMPKPFTEHSGSSQHLHISLWRGDEPAFAPDNGVENELALHAIAGLLEHLPSITLFGAHSVNAYRRFTPDSFAPATVTWSRDNRSAAVRSLIEPDPSASRIELRSGASDANPYWLIASALAAVIAGLEASAMRRLPSEATSTAKVFRYLNHSVWQSNWPLATTPSSRYWAQTRYSTSPLWPAASGQSSPTKSATGNAGAI